MLGFPNIPTNLGRVASLSLGFVVLTFAFCKAQSNKQSDKSDLKQVFF